MRSAALRRLALAALLLTVAATVVVSTQLSRGVAEVGRHWWSTLAVALPAVVAIGVWAAARGR